MLSTATERLRPSDKVIEIPDPKSVKQAIVDSWIAYTPQQVVKLIKKCYPNFEHSHRQQPGRGQQSAV
jgi:hypothetical protein